MNKTLSLLFALAFLTGGAAAQPKRRAPSRPAAGVTLNIKAGVITTAGDAKPVARREFMVFKDDIEPTLATIDDGQGDHLDVLKFHFSEQLKELGDEHYDKALAKLQPLIIAKFTTDFQGNASVRLTGGGSFWLYGSSQKIGRSSCLWYMKITPGKNSDLILDNNNAVYCG